MKTLVIGGKGYLGSALVPYLKSRGISVQVLDARDGPEGNAWNLTERSLRSFDAVINLAGVSSDPAAKAYPEETWEINLDLAVHIATILPDRCRLIHASTCSIATGMETGFELMLGPPEACLTGGGFPYAESKLSAERDLLFEFPGKAITVVRMGTLVGFSPHWRYDLLFNKMVVDAWEKRIITAERNTLRPVCSLQSACFTYLSAMLLRAKSERVVHAVDANLSVVDSAKVVKALLPNAKLKLVGRGSRSYTAEIGKAGPQLHHLGMEIALMVAKAKEGVATSDRAFQNLVQIPLWLRYARSFRK